MAHSNEALIRRGYEAFEKGDIESVLGILDPNIMWHAAGRNHLSGDYEGHQQVLDFFAKLAASTAGTFKLAVHDVLANDGHAVVLAEWSAVRDGKILRQRGVHVWHVTGGQATEFWSFQDDPSAEDEFFS